MIAPKIRAVKKFNERKATIDLLSALEYGTRKEETTIIAPLLGALGLPHLRKARLCEAILVGPGFERFFLAVLRSIKPFAEMLTAVYSFLSSFSATAERRASLFRVSKTGAKSVFAFDLDAFPKQLLRAVIETLDFRSILRIREIEPSAAEIDEWHWQYSEDGKAWEQVTPRWDGDFYDDGFYRALSYAWTISGRADRALQARLTGLVEPILDRVRALVEPLDWAELAWAARSEDDRTTGSYMNGVAETIQWTVPRSMNHSLDRDLTVNYLSKVLKTDGNEPVMVGHKVRWHLISMCIALSLWDSKHTRNDRDDWLSKRVGRPFNLIDAASYLDFLEPLVERYNRQLDELVQVIDHDPVIRVTEAVMEFLALPFWKDRWFLFELWTLCYTLEIAGNVYRVKLCNLDARDDGTVEWKLPGAAATTPVATIGEGLEVECWTQKKTYHPQTGRGLEPDLRWTLADDYHEDILVIENKDRGSAKKGEMAEIVERYATGTKARRVFLVNYETFTKGVMQLEELFLDGRVQILGDFKPGSVPSSFRETIVNLLRSVIDRRLSAATVTEPSEEIECITWSGPTAQAMKITLEWRSGPSDLDLHAWVRRRGKITHVFYGNRVCEGTPPLAELDQDAQHCPGRETLSVQLIGVDEIMLGVHRYSSGDLMAANAHVEICFGDKQSIVLRGPDELEGAWWHIGQIVPARQKICLDGVCSDAPPVEHTC